MVDFVGARWNDLVDYFRNLPENESTHSFSAQAGLLYNHSNFNPIVQRIFQRAVRSDPTKFYFKEIRRYLNKHRDPVIEGIYMSQFRRIVPTDEFIPEDDARIWAMKSALAVVAVVLDQAKGGQAQTEAKERMRKFATAILNNFPTLPQPFYVSLRKIQASGVFTEKTPRFQTASSAAEEKGDGPPHRTKRIAPRRPLPERLFTKVVSSDSEGVIPDPWKAGLAAVKPHLPENKGQAAQAS